MCAKLLNTVIESIYSKGDAQEAYRLMQNLFHSSLDKLIAMSQTYDRLKAYDDREKGKRKAQDADPEKVKDDEKEEDVSMEDDVTDVAKADKLEFGWREIEQAMPVSGVSYADESHEAFCRGELLRSQACPPSS